MLFLFSWTPKALSVVEVLSVTEDAEGSFLCRGMVGCPRDSRFRRVRRAGLVSWGDMSPSWVLRRRLTTLRLVMPATKRSVRREPTTLLRLGVRRGWLGLSLAFAFGASSFSCAGQ